MYTDNFFFFFTLSTNSPFLIFFLLWVQAVHLLIAGCAYSPGVNPNCIYAVLISDFLSHLICSEWCAILLHSAKKQTSCESAVESYRVLELRRSRGGLNWLTGDDIFTVTVCSITNCCMYNVFMIYNLRTVKDWRWPKWFLLIWGIWSKNFTNEFFPLICCCGAIGDRKHGNLPAAKLLI